MKRNYKKENETKRKIKAVLNEITKSLCQNSTERGNIMKTTNKVLPFLSEKKKKNESN
jgi:hypothetical protein